MDSRTFGGGLDAAWAAPPPGSTTAASRKLDVSAIRIFRMAIPSQAVSLSSNVSMTQAVPGKFGAEVVGPGYVRIDMRPVSVARVALLCGFTLAAVLLPWAAAFGGQSSVVLKNLNYNPRSIHVNVGDTVTWYDQDS